MFNKYELILSNECINVIRYEGKTIQLSSNIDINKYIEQLENIQVTHEDIIVDKKRKNKYCS